MDYMDSHLWLLASYSFQSHGECRIHELLGFPRESRRCLHFLHLKDIFFLRSPILINQALVGSSQKGQMEGLSDAKKDSLGVLRHV